MFSYSTSDIVQSPPLYGDRRLAVLAVVTPSLNEDPMYTVQPLDGGSVRTLHATWLKPVRFSKEERAQAMELVEAYNDKMEQMDKGLYAKYRVCRAIDNKEVSTAMFVLDRRDPAALVAMITYASITTSLELKKDLLLLAAHVLKENNLRWYRTTMTDSEVRDLLFSVIDDLEESMREEIRKEAS